MADVELSPEAAVVASKIRTIDRDLDQMEKDREESIVRGMRAPSGAAVINKWGQDRADTRREALLRERAELASQLRKLVGGSVSGVGNVRGVSANVRLLVSPLSPSAAAGVGYEGRITVDSGGCVAVGDAALVGLPGSRLNQDGSFTLVTPGDAIDALTLRVGDQFRLGGTLAARTDTWARPYLPDGAGSCGSRQYLLVFGG
jgi:hypothetical protein